MIHTAKLLPFTDYYQNGSLRATGQTRNALAEGYWEWFRKNGTLMRSGNFSSGVQIGEWITYDQQGTVYKVTDLKTGNPSLPLTRIVLEPDA